MDQENTENRIEEIKDLAKEAAASSPKFMEPGTKVKKPRGPYKKTGAKKEDPTSQASPIRDTGPKVQMPPTSEFVKPLLQVGSGLAVKYAEHPAAALGPEEMEAAANALGGLLDKWFPNGLDKYGHEITAGVILAQWGFRVQALKIQKQREKEANSQGGQGQPNSGANGPMPTQNGTTGASPFSMNH